MVRGESEGYRINVEEVSDRRLCDVRIDITWLEPSIPE